MSCKLFGLGVWKAQRYRRMGPLSRPFIRSGRWSQTTTVSSKVSPRLNSNYLVGMFACTAGPK